MKTSIVFMLLNLSLSLWLKGQDYLGSKTQGEFSLGFSTPFLHGGASLLEGQALRAQGLSYFSNEQGQRNQVGVYPRLRAWSLGLGFYEPIKKLRGLSLGSVFRASLAGSQPRVGGYEEGFFFNFLSIGLASKYYPWQKQALFFKLDGGLASVFTKNRYLNAEGEQRFFHQFGIGSNASLSLGHSFFPFKHGLTSLDLQFVYQFNSTRVEVNGLGNEQWTYSALSLLLALNF